MTTGSKKPDDISKGGRAKQAALSQLRMAEAVFDCSVSCLVILDRDFNFIRVNPAYARACRKDIEEFAGRNHFELYPSDARSIFEEVLRTKQPFQTYARAFRFPDQPERDVTYWDWTLVPVLDQQGEVEYLVFSLNDVTERKRAEDSALANESRLRLALRNINMAVFHQDTALRYTWMYQPQLGYMPEQVIGRTDDELLPPAAARRVTELKQRLLQTGELVHEEVPVVLNDATHVFELLAEPMRDRMGKLIGITGVSLDITERKRAEQALRDSEERLRAIFDGALDGVLVADAESRRFVAANPAICRMLGYTREEIAGIGVANIHPTEELPKVMEQFEAMLRGEIEMAVDVPILCKDGSVSYADIKASHIQLGSRQCLLGVFCDVSQRKEIDQRLVESEARFRGLVEQSIAGIYIVQDERLAYANPRFAQIHGYDTAEEMLDSGAVSSVAEADRAMVLDHRGRMIAGEVLSLNYTYTALKKDGSTFDVGVHDSRSVYRGRPAIIGLMQDISEKRRADERIAEYIRQMETAFMSTVTVAMNMGEMRDPYTTGHERKVAEIAVAIAAEMGWDASRQEGLQVAGCLHDIGKITIPSEILSKPGKLNAIEYELIKVHPQSAYNILKDVAFPWPIAQVALQHHERMDGSGYPQGLKGDEILPEARIMAIADVVEAMSTHRPYRPGLGIEKAMNEIERGRGTAYDADAVDACLRLFREKGYQPST